MPACRSKPCKNSSVRTLGVMTGRATGSNTSSATCMPGRTRSRSLTRPATSRRGRRPPDVQRQWCGAAGKKENCIVTVHLAGARRLPRPARRRVVPAEVLVRRPRGRHPRRHGVPAQVEDRPETRRPRDRQRPALRLVGLRRRREETGGNKGGRSTIRFIALRPLFLLVPNTVRHKTCANFSVRRKSKPCLPRTFIREPTSRRVFSKFCAEQYWLVPLFLLSQTMTTRGKFSDR